jgi:hypothetical protein
VTFSGFYKARGWPLLTFMCSCLTIVRHERLKETGDCSTWPLKKDNGQLRRRSWETWFRTVLVSCWIGPWSGEGDEQWFKTAPFVSWKWLFFTLVPKRFKLNNWDLNKWQSICYCALGLNSIESLSYSAIYTTILGFWTIQFDPWTIISCHFALNQLQTLLFLQLNFWCL